MYTLEYIRNKELRLTYTLVINQLDYCWSIGEPEHKDRYAKSSRGGCIVSETGVNKWTSGINYTSVDSYIDGIHGSNGSRYIDYIYTDHVFEEYKFSIVNSANLDYDFGGTSAGIIKHDCGALFDNNTGLRIGSRYH